MSYGLLADVEKEQQRECEEEKERENKDMMLRGKRKTRERKKKHNSFKMLTISAYRLVDTIVRVGQNQEGSQNTQCGGPIAGSEAGAGALVTVRCHIPLRGRYISIHGGLGVNDAILTLCEVYIYESQLPCADPTGFPGW